MREMNQLNSITQLSAEQQQQVNNLKIIVNGDQRQMKLIKEQMTMLQGLLDINDDDDNNKKKEEEEEEEEEEDDDNKKEEDGDDKDMGDEEAEQNITSDLLVNMAREHKGAIASSAQKKQKKENKQNQEKCMICNGNKHTNTYQRRDCQKGGIEQVAEQMLSMNKKEVLEMSKIFVQQNDQDKFIVDMDTAKTKVVKNMSKNDKQCFACHSVYSKKQAATHERLGCCILRQTVIFLWRCHKNLPILKYANTETNVEVSIRRERLEKMTPPTTIKTKKVVEYADDESSEEEITMLPNRRRRGEKVEFTAITEKMSQAKNQEAYVIVSGESVFGSHRWLVSADGSTIMVNDSPLMLSTAIEIELMKMDIAMTSDVIANILAHTVVEVIPNDDDDDDDDESQMSFSHDGFGQSSENYYSAVNTENDAIEQGDKNDDIENDDNDDKSNTKDDEFVSRDEHNAINMSGFYLKRSIDDGCGSDDSECDDDDDDDDLVSEPVLKKSRVAHIELMDVFTAIDELDAKIDENHLDLSSKIDSNHYDVMNNMKKIMTVVTDLVKQNTELRTENEALRAKKSIVSPFRATLGRLQVTSKMTENLFLGGDVSEPFGYESEIPTVNPADMHFFNM